MSLGITKKIFNLIRDMDNYDTSKYNIEYKEFDIIISGGGFSGYYYAGIFEIITNLEKNDKVKINNIYCTSSGVIVVLFYLKPPFCSHY